MISDSEFVAIREFDKTLARNTRNAQAIIDGKNAVIEQLERCYFLLKAELEEERGRRRRAEFLLNR